MELHRQFLMGHEELSGWNARWPTAWETRGLGALEWGARLNGGRGFLCGRAGAGGGEGVEREEEDGGGAGVGGGVEADGAAVGFDPAECFGESDAAVTAGGFGGEEGGECLAHDLVVHADAAVGDLDDDLGVEGIEADLDEDVGKGSGGGSQCLGF